MRHPFPSYAPRRCASLNAVVVLREGRGAHPYSMAAAQGLHNQSIIDALLPLRGQVQENLPKLTPERLQHTPTIFASTSEKIIENTSITNMATPMLPFS